MIVRFSNVTEFCEEIAARGPNMEAVVHATNLWEADKTMPNAIQHHYVVGTFLRGIGDTRTVIVTFRKYCGQEITGPGAAVGNERSKAQASRIMEEIRATCTAERLACVGGIYEETA